MKLRHQQPSCANAEDLDSVFPLKSLASAPSSAYFPPYLQVSRLRPDSPPTKEVHKSLSSCSRRLDGVVQWRLDRQIALLVSSFTSLSTLAMDAGAGSVRSLPLLCPFLECMLLECLRSVQLCAAVEDPLTNVTPLTRYVRLRKNECPWGYRYELECRGSSGPCLTGLLCDGFRAWWPADNRGSALIHCFCFGC